ncbi:MAG: hypothetical protein ACFB16_02010 [Phormidesmis sp.]
MFSNIEPTAGDHASATSTISVSAEENSLNDTNKNENSREPVQVMVVGSNPGIDSVIKALHSLGFAEADDWSKPQRYPNSDRTMSIVTKWRQL